METEGAEEKLVDEMDLMDREGNSASEAGLRNQTQPPLTDGIREETIGYFDSQITLQRSVKECERFLLNEPLASNSLQCDICRESFPDVLQYNDHMFSHENDRPFSCEVCGKSFKYSHHLSEHLRFHSGDASYFCEDCGKNFDSLMALSGHVKVHKRTKSLTCEFCNKKFPRTDHLNIHRRIHTGDKPYTCDICGKKLADSSNFIKHKQSHRRNADAPFACQVCEKRFKREGDLGRHFRQNHSDNQFAEAAGGGSSRKRHFSNLRTSRKDRVISSGQGSDAVYKNGLSDDNRDMVRTESQAENNVNDPDRIVKDEEAQVLEQFKAPIATNDINPTFASSRGRKRRRAPLQSTPVRRSQRVHHPRLDLRADFTSEDFDRSQKMGNSNAHLLPKQGRPTSSRGRGRRGRGTQRMSSVVSQNQLSDASMSNSHQTGTLNPQLAVAQLCNAAGMTLVPQSLNVKMEPCSYLEQDLANCAEGSQQFGADFCTMVSTSSKQCHLHITPATSSEGDSCNVCDYLISQISALLGELRKHAQTHEKTCSGCGKTFPSNGLLLEHVCERNETTTNTTISPTQDPSIVLQPDLIIQDRLMKKEEENSTNTNLNASSAPMALTFDTDLDDTTVDLAGFESNETLTAEAGGSQGVQGGQALKKPGSQAPAASASETDALQETETVDAANEDAEDDDDFQSSSRSGTVKVARLASRHGRQRGRTVAGLRKGPHPEGSYQCRICLFKFLSPRALSHHVVRRHRVETQSRCDVCGLVVRPGNLSRHRASHRKDELIHRASMKDKKGLPCRHCKAVFSSRSQLASHQSQCHSDPYLCVQCGQIFKHAIHLKRHQVVHSSARPHICDVCGKDFKTVGAVKKHLFSHATGTPCVCEICGSSFKSSLHLSKHRVTHQANRRTYICELCGKSFKTPRNLTQHQKTHSRIRTAEICDGEEEQCEICGEKLKNSRALKFHKWNVHKDPGEDKRFTCKVCSRPFSRKAELQVHLRSHTGEKPFTCQLCGSKIGYKSSFKVHMRRHSQCTLCSEWFIDSDALLMHVETAHNQMRSIAAPLPAFLG